MIVRCSIPRSRKMTKQLRDVPSTAVYPKLVKFWGRRVSETRNIRRN